MTATFFQVLGTLALALMVFFLYLWSSYNSFIKKRNQVKTDYSDIDIQLKRRGSLIQNLADLVHGYAKHEKGTFEEVAKARSAIDHSKTIQDVAKANDVLSQALRGLYVVVENYPKLQASDNYKTLREDLLSTENLIAGYREDYNRSVQEYNNSIQTFPNLLVSGLFGFQDEQLFQSAETTVAAK